MSARGFELGDDAIAAQITALIAFADAPVSGTSKISFYDTPRPPRGDAPGADPLVVLQLAKPCATIAGMVATLIPLAGYTPMVLVSGVPLWARWERSDGKLVTDGGVSDMDNDGEFQIAGGTALPGNESPNLQAGGLVIVGPLEFN